MAKRKTFFVSTDVFGAGLTPVAIATFAYLSFCCDKDGKCYPPVKTIAANCGTSENTIRKAIHELEEQKMIAKEVSFTESRNGNQRQQANVYHLQDTPFKNCTPAKFEGVSLHLVKGVGSNSEGEINNNSNRTTLTSLSVGQYGSELDELIENLELKVYDDQGFAATVENTIRAMFLSDSIRVNGLTIPQKEVRRVLRQLSIGHIDRVQTAVENAERMKNSMGFLISYIYNSVADQAVEHLRYGVG